MCSYTYVKRPQICGQNRMINPFVIVILYFYIWLLVGALSCVMKQQTDVTKLKAHLLFETCEVLCYVCTRALLQTSTSTVVSVILVVIPLFNKCKCPLSFLSAAESTATTMAGEERSEHHHSRGWGLPRPGCSDCPQCGYKSHTGSLVTGLQRAGGWGRRLGWCHKVKATSE